MKGYRTFVFAFLLMLLGLVQQSLPEIQALMSPQAYGYLTFAIGILVGGLRLLTTTPAFSDQEKDKSEPFRGPGYD